MALSTSRLRVKQKIRPITLSVASRIGHGTRAAMDVLIKPRLWRVFAGWSIGFGKVLNGQQAFVAVIMSAALRFSRKLDFIRRSKERCTSAKNCRCAPFFFAED